MLLYCICSVGLYIISSIHHSTIFSKENDVSPLTLHVEGVCMYDVRSPSTREQGELHAILFTCTSHGHFCSGLSILVRDLVLALFRDQILTELIFYIRLSK
jgi:hypothetical protein